MPLERTPEIQRKLQELAEIENRLRDDASRDEDLRLRLARTRFDHFCEYVMRDEETGDSIVLAPVHHDWISFLMFCWSHRMHVAIQAPFGHGKTAIFSVALPLWCLGVQPSLRIKLFSANDDTAKERVDLVRQYINDSDEYHKVFPHILASESQEWSKHKIYIQRRTMAKDASLQALGCLSSGIGGRSDINIFDDINDAKNTLHQPKLREQVIRNYRAVHMSRLDRRIGLVAMVCTRWHDKDTVGTIMADEDMRSNYGILIQRVSQDFDCVECEYLMGNPRKGWGGESELGKLLNQYEQGLI